MSTALTWSVLSLLRQGPGECRPTCAGEVLMLPVRAIEKQIKKMSPDDRVTVPAEDVFCDINNL